PRLFIQASPPFRGEEVRHTTLQVSLAAVNIGGEPKALLCLEDMTDRLRTEERVREQAALLDIAHDAITVLDLDGHVLYWNYAAERLYGWPIEEALGRQANHLFFHEVPPEFLQALESVLKY